MSFVNAVLIPLLKVVAALVGVVLLFFVLLFIMRSNPDFTMAQLQGDWYAENSGENHYAKLSIHGDTLADYYYNHTASDKFADSYQMDYALIKIVDDKLLTRHPSGSSWSEAWRIIHLDSQIMHLEGDSHALYRYKRVR